MRTRCFIGDYRDLRGMKAMARSNFYESGSKHSGDSILYDALGYGEIWPTLLARQCLFFIGGRKQIGSDLQDIDDRHITFTDPAPYYALVVTHRHLTSKNYTVLQVTSAQAMIPFGHAILQDPRVRAIDNLANPQQNTVTCQQIHDACMDAQRGEPLLKEMPPTFEYDY